LPSALWPAFPNKYLSAPTVTATYREDHRYAL
jgi:hypothetical protein